jgi:hypothetical protein
MDFYTGESTNRYGASQPASSVFLTTLPSDEASSLSWDFFLGQLQLMYGEGSGRLFTKIGTTTQSIIQTPTMFLTA